MDNIVVFFYFFQKENEHHTFLGRKKEMSPTFANRRFRAKKIRTEIFNLIWLELYYVLLHTVFCMILLLLYLYYGFNLILLVTQIYIYMKKILCSYKVWRDIIMSNVQLSVIHVCHLLSYGLIFFYRPFWISLHMAKNQTILIFTYTWQ